CNIFLQHSILAPAVESMIDGLPRTVSFRHFTPLGPTAHHPGHDVEEAAMVFPLTTCFAAVWKKIFDHFVLTFTEYVAPYFFTPGRRRKASYF
ncbi:MAG: hypothetical protein M3Q07_15815, partial [Pseudobdellovibrionaceae bacterium]|nr:hypothetical protein [Pseudobdellovibrionaceae bacterium]